MNEEAMNMIHLLVVAVPACLLSADLCSSSDYVFDLCGLTLFSTQSNSRRALKKHTGHVVSAIRSTQASLVLSAYLFLSQLLPA